MIRRIRTKFVVISGLSLLLVFSGIFLLLIFFSRAQINRTMDALTDAISSNGGEFPPFEASDRPLSRPSPIPDLITEETQFSVRFFTVWLTADHRIHRVNMDSVASIAEEEVEEYVTRALDEHRERGWVSDYRYKATQTDSGAITLVFVNGSMHEAVMGRLLLTALLVLVGSAGLVLLLTIVLSKYAVRPIAESYEKQKQFITDANHELKTPLTLILSNLDIVESELGKNEWLDDIRSEGERMGLLINQMVTLSRMDESDVPLSLSSFSLSEAVWDVASEFDPVAGERNKSLTCSIQPSIVYRGDEGMIRRLVSILLDNAVKYCDPGGSIQLTLSQKHNPILVLENTYAQVDQLELNRLFDRFYRADRARTFSGSFGVGLSIAQSIVHQHHGSISAYKRDGLIGFKVELR